MTLLLVAGISAYRHSRSVCKINIAERVIVGGHRQFIQGASIGQRVGCRDDGFVWVCSGVGQKRLKTKRMKIAKRGKHSKSGS